MTVHQLKETKSGTVTAKCGLTGKSGTLPTSGWHSDITCPDCLGGHDEHAQAGVLGDDAGS